jgi:glycosyltransferase involved in cell wall biosynthesis
VLPSSQEGLPRSVMESLCCGVPVIASDIRGNRDLVAGGGGFLFPFGDTGALASHLDWFARNPDAAREMGLHGRSSVGIYATSSIIALHEELYAESTQGRSRDPRSTAVAQTRI